ncbi:MAG: nitroreductase family protein [Acidobacteriota bacterium]
MKPTRDELLRGALDRFPRWRLFGEGTATARFEFSEPVYAAGFVTRAIEQARAFRRIPDLNLSGPNVKLAVALALTDQGLSTDDEHLLEALERAADHPGRPADTDAPILSLFADRWSPHSFTDEPVPRTLLNRIFEAARWSPSSFNEQPWRYVVVTEAARRDEVAEALVEGNSWARSAPVMVLVAVARKFKKNRRINRHAMYDAGAATLAMMAEATALGLVGHQMAGFDPKLARDLFHVPTDFEPAVMLVLGYWGEGKGLSDALLDREEAARERHPTAEWVFWQDWGQPDSTPPA